ncbi:MerR family transcriptional regulator [Amnibacterium endophyticum]|uniref:MerR family transcriptional regulator n=1 Tax=Amnibacterium endophyticum TaxID=2109337 RepID=A0ABW4LHR1_9MICO
MSTMTMRETESRTGLPAPTLRYYEEIGLIGPIAREEHSGHRRYSEADLDALQALACLRGMGVGIEDMRTYQANRALGAVAAGEQRDLLTRHARRIEAEIERLTVHVRYLAEKAALWDARDRGDARAEATAKQRVEEILPALEGSLR